MRLLLDTHVLLWWLADDRRLKALERRAIADRDALVYVSAVTVWEIAIKRNLGRLDLDVELLEQELLSALPHHHEDPFDRMLVAQAQTEGLTLVSHDKAFKDYDVALLPE